MKLKVGDSVLLRYHKENVSDPRYTWDYRIMSFLGKTQVEVVDPKGKAKIVHIFNVK